MNYKNATILKEECMDFARRLGKREGKRKRQLKDMNQNHVVSREKFAIERFKVLH